MFQKIPLKASYRAVANMITIIQGKHTSSLQLKTYIVVKRNCCFIEIEYVSSCKLCMTRTNSLIDLVPNNCCMPVFLSLFGSYMCNKYQIVNFFCFFSSLPAVVVFVDFTPPSISYYLS